MSVNDHQPLSSQILAGYPSIDNFSKLVALSPATAPLSARVLLNLCRNVARDLSYVARLQEDVQATLNDSPAYHAKWIAEVRIAAAEALGHVNKHIESKMPRQHLGGLQQHARELQARVASVVAASKKDAEGIASLREQLGASHASLMAVAGLMQQLAFHNGGLLPDKTQLQQFRSLSQESLKQAATNTSAGAVLGGSK